MGTVDARANGIGDLYVATSGGVVEAHVATASIVNTIPISPEPTALAFAPDGRSLYVVSDGAHVIPIDIETLDPRDPIAMPGDVTALAFPSGQILVGAVPSHRTLVFVRPSGESVTETAELPGAGNLLAGDRHDPRVVVAEAGKSWLDVVDPSTATIRNVAIDGEIQAVAIERDRGGALVATAKPDQIVRVDLTTLAFSWKTALPGTPAYVVALSNGAVAGAGKSIWKVDSSSAATWATAKSEILGLAVSDEGKALHVAEDEQVEIFGTDATLLKTLPLAGKAISAMAPVPAGSSLFTGKGHNGTGASQKPGGSARPGSSFVPPTSTLSDVERVMSEPRTQSAAVVGAIVLVLCWLAIRRHDRRHRPTA